MTSNSIAVLDTSFLVALFNSDDSNHKKATDLQKKIIGKNLLLAEYVIVELSSILAMKGSLDISKQAVNELIASKEIEFIPCSDVFAETMQRFYQQKKYKLSFVDCALIEIKSKYKASSIITFDKELTGY
jgi:predicted nucleic acid-binding protein